MNESSKPPGKQMKDYSSYAFGERNRPRKTKKCLDDEQALLMTLQVYTQSTRKNASKEEHMEFRGMCICQ